MLFVEDNWLRITTMSRWSTRPGDAGRGSTAEGVDGVAPFHALLAEHALAEWAEVALEEVARLVKSASRPTVVRGCRR